MNVRPTHYLESFDSVRSRVGGDDAEGDGRAAQILTSQAEAIVALAFGHDLVAPQSYVLDSVACQSVIGSIAEARRTVERSRPNFWDDRSYPFRVHLHPFQGQNLDAFQDVAHAVFAATADGTFTSSMFGDLAGHSQLSRILGELSAGSPEPMRWLDDWRSNVFDGMWSYFRSAGRHTPRLVVSPTPLDPTLTLASGFEAVRTRLQTESAEPSELLTALDGLLAASAADEPFAGRSRLHGDGPWAQDGRTAREVVNDEAAFALVLEVVDTLYNRVVSNSIGPAVSVYSTSVSSTHSAGVLSDIAHAQDAAVDVGETTGADQRPPFDVTVDLAEHDLSKWHDLGSPDVLATLLIERESDKWKKSFADLRAATDETSFQKVWSSHLKLIANATSGVVSVENHEGSFRMAIQNWAGETAVIGSSVVLGFANPWWTLTTLGTPVLRPVRRKAAARLRSRSMFTALGRSVAYSRDGGS